MKTPNIAKLLTEARQQARSRDDYLTKEQICDTYTCSWSVISHHIERGTFVEKSHIQVKSGGKLALYRSEDVYEWAKKYGFLKTFDNRLANAFVRCGFNFNKKIEADA